MFGHSAGAQFVHRFVAFTNSEAGKCDAGEDGAGQGSSSKLLRAVAANAGSYTLPTFKEENPFPFGFHRLEASFSDKDLAAFVSAPLTILVGEKDTGVDTMKICNCTYTFLPPID